MSIKSKFIEETNDGSLWINNLRYDFSIEQEKDFLNVKSAVYAAFHYGKDSITPVDMVLHCPDCGKRHIDEGEFEHKEHPHTHACQHCGFVWRPAVVATRGVHFLPGFKNEQL